mgnify:CR=1 FL=1
MGNQQEDLKRNWLIDMIKDAGFGCLATMEDNQPRVRPMMPHLAEDGKLLLAVLSHSRTITQIQKNPSVQMCYIDRKMCFCRITGKASVSMDLDKKEIVWNNIPMLRNYFTSPSDPNYVLLEIETEIIESMTPTQKLPDQFVFKLVQ